jgi:hypothetical protein
MSDVFLGHDRHNRDFFIPTDAFRTHFHLIGGTGKGKTTAIHTMLHPLLRNHRDPAAFFIVDRLGNLSWELLLWINSRFCPEYVRDRVVYIEPAREDVTIGFNPLLYSSKQEGYYKVERATEIILRAWESVNIEAMPRLARWTFNAFWAAAQLGLTVTDCTHLLNPGSDYHAPILKALPPMLRAEWAEMKGNEAVRILDSSRNRLRPYFTAPVLQAMFGSSKSYLDVPRFMREGKIVILNLAQRGRLSSQLGDAIGGLVINEVLTTARCQEFGVVYPTYLLLDEFQNFVGPDIQSAIPEMRQLGVRLLLSHQSFSQLKRGDLDLTPLIWQAQSRLAFGVQGEDADILGQEFASLTYDPMRVKDVNYSTRQRHAGFGKEILTSWGDARGGARGWDEKYGRGWNRGEGEVKRDGSPDVTRSKNSGRSDTVSRGRSGSDTHTQTIGKAEHLVPLYEEVREVSGRVYFTGDEWDRVWARDMRLLPTGVALVRLVNDPQLHTVAVQRSAMGYLGWDAAQLRRKLPMALDQLDEFVEKNFRSEFFTQPEVIERETEERIRRVTSQVNADSSRAAIEMKPNEEAEEHFSE